MSTIITWLVMLVIAYLLGSISSAIIVCKILNLPDPRTQGSQNPGATNVLRFASKPVAITVLVFDFLKGLLPILLAKLFQVSGFALGTVALAATAGHMYPIFFKFKGGKGVATAAGAIFGLSLLLGLCTLVVWFITTAITRYVSLASMIAAASAPFIALFIGGISYFLPLAVISLLVIYRHMGNIQRLRDGTESKLKI